MKKIVIRIMNAAGWVNTEEKDGRLLFWDDEFLSPVQIIIGPKMIEKAVQIIQNRAETYGKTVGRYETEKIIRDYQILMGHN